MFDFLKKYQKFVYSIPLIFSILFLAFFINWINNEKQRDWEKEMGNNIHTIRFFGEYFRDKLQEQPDFNIFPVLYYVDVSLDIRNQIFSAVYDDQWNLLTPRFLDDIHSHLSVFCLTNYEQAMIKIKNNKSGELSLPFYHFTMDLYYQWFDSAEKDNHYLMAIGLIREHIQDERKSLQRSVLIFMIFVIFIDMVNFYQNLKRRK